MGCDSVSLFGNADNLHMQNMIRMMEDSFELRLPDMPNKYQTIKAPECGPRGDRFMAINVPQEIILNDLFDSLDEFEEDTNITMCYNGNGFTTYIVKFSAKTL